jgi:hypothetical protein
LTAVTLHLELISVIRYHTDLTVWRKLVTTETSSPTWRTASLVMCKQVTKVIQRESDGKWQVYVYDSDVNMWLTCASDVFATQQAAFEHAREIDRLEYRCRGYIQLDSWRVPYLIR